MSSQKYKSSSLRLQGFDYSSDGAYFITICSYERKNIFGKIIRGEFIESTIGKIIKDELLSTASKRFNMRLGKWVIMPNHIHFIIFIVTNSDVHLPNYHVPSYHLQLNTPNSFSIQKNNIASMIRGFKSAVSSKVKLLCAEKVWQTNYFERIIRTQSELEKIENYIEDNIQKWETDKNYTSD